MAALPRANARKPWTPEESELLHQLAAEGNPAKAIADRLERSLVSVMSRAAKLRISMSESGSAGAFQRGAESNGRFTGLGKQA